MEALNYLWNVATNFRQHHLQCINPANPQVAPELPAFSFLIRDLAGHLFDHELVNEAQVYYEFLRTIPEESNGDILLQIGRCHLAKGNSSSAEESFLAAIDVDADSIDARVELANLYSTAHEDEEALILVTEAMTLQQAQAGKGGSGGRLSSRLRAVSGRLPSGLIPRRYRPKRLVDPVRRRQEEVDRARRLSTQFVHVQELKARIRDGDEAAVPAWMAAAKELIDDFRSYRKFYSWDNYLKFLGRSNDGVQIHQPGEESGLDAIRQRLSKGVCFPESYVYVAYVLTDIRSYYPTAGRRGPGGPQPAGLQGVPGHRVRELARPVHRLRHQPRGGGPVRRGVPGVRGGQGLDGIHRQRGQHFLHLHRLGW